LDKQRFRCRRGDTKLAPSDRAPHGVGGLGE
jgi:hypothetical protein